MFGSHEAVSYWTVVLTGAYSGTVSELDLCTHLLGIVALDLTGLDTVAVQKV